MSLPPSQPPPLNNATKPKRSVSFLNHSAAPSGDAGSTQLGRSSFQPGRRRGYVRKGPVQSDSEADDDDQAETEDHYQNRSEGEDDDDEEDQHQKDAVKWEGNMSQHRAAAGTVKSLHGIIAKAAGRPGQNYVRKAPVNSDTESDEDSRRKHQEANVNKGDEDGSESDGWGGLDGLGGNVDDASLARTFAQTRISGPGQNYVRKAPMNSDTESDEEQLNGKAMKKPASQSTSSSGLQISNAHNNVQEVALKGRELGKGRGQGQHRSPPPQEKGLLDVAIPSAVLGLDAPSATVPDTRVGAGAMLMMPNTADLAYVPNAAVGAISSTSATVNVANPMAIYQQQQQEMMMIMQQQQIQIATMQQQQQAYQLLVLQQQQHHHQQLQAAQQQHSRAPSSAGSLPPHDEDDDDLPLSDKKQQLPDPPHLSSLIPPQPGTPPLQQPQPTFGALPTLHLSPDLQPSIMAPPVSASYPYAPLQQVSLQHSRQPSASSIHSINSHSGPALPPAHLLPSGSSPLNPVASSPLLQPQQFYHAQQHHQHSHSFPHPQPRLADFIEEEQERMRQDRQQYQQQHAGLSGTGGGAQLLTSSFPAGYRNSLGSTSFSQLNLDRGSVNSLHSAGSNGSNNGAAGSKPNSFRHSLLPSQPQTLLQSISPSPAPSCLLPHSPLVHQTLIHVEAKPPPPQTGLVGAISAMEREKKLAKANGANQLQFQHQQHQQQMMMNSERERWLAEQRRLAWDTEQSPQQQQQHLQQQGMQPQPHSFFLPAIPATPLWTVDDEEEDDQPLGVAH